MVAFVGGELSDFIPSSGEVVESSTSTHYDSSVGLRTAILINGLSTNYALTPVIEVQNNFWLHAEFYIVGSRTNITGRTCLAFMSGIDEKITLKSRSDGNCDVYGGAINIGQFTLSAGVRTILDINCIMNFGGTHEIKVYINGLEVVSGTWQDVTLLGIDRLKLFALNPRSSSPQNYVTAWSQVIVDNVSTIGKKLGRLNISAAGTYSDGNGEYTDINERFLSDTTFWEPVDPGNKLSWNPSDYSPLGLYPISVITSMRCQAVNGINGIRPFVRKNGVNYFGETKPLPYGSIGIVQVEMPLNPSTNTNWTTDAINSFEFGIEGTL